MAVNWDLLIKIAGPLVGGSVGWTLNRLSERRSRLITYYGHVGAFITQQLQVNTHQVVIRNVGKKAATNVRVSHHFLPEFNIWPRVKHAVEDVSCAGKDIVIPALVPGEQVTFSYLSF